MALLRSVAINHGAAALHGKMPPDGRLMTQAEAELKTALMT
jgi:hypothetical protein